MGAPTRKARHVIVIGLILLLAALGAGVWLFLAAQHLTSAVDLTQWGMTIGFSPLALIIAGVGVTLAFLAGLSFVRFAVGRSSRLRKERKENERLAGQQRAVTEREATRRLEEERSRPGSFTQPLPERDSGLSVDTRTQIPPPPPPPPAS